MSEDNVAASSGVPPESATAAAAVAEEETKKEEESTTKNDTTKNDGASEPKPSGSGRAKRERKTVKAFNPEEFVEEKKEIEVPDGAGIKIEDMREFFMCNLYPVFFKCYVYILLLVHIKCMLAEFYIYVVDICMLLFMYIHLLIIIVSLYQPWYYSAPILCL